jgi:hypothetical protein
MCHARTKRTFSSAAALALSINEKYIYYRPTRTFPPKHFHIRFILHALTLLNAAATAAIDDDDHDDDYSLIFKSIYF